ncbi:MAG: 4Fe-4S binding protein [Desulfitobacteriaceae bacterium]
MKDMIAQIDINYDLCQDPLQCRQCLSFCPTVVFVCGPTKIWKYRETDPKEYKVVARYLDKCSGCGDCQKVCPTGALKLSFIDREELKQRYREERAEQLRQRSQG